MRVAAAWVALALTGCGPAETVPARVAFPQTPPSPGGERMEALLIGTLALDGRCLVARHDGGDTMLSWDAHLRLDTTAGGARVEDTETGVWAAVGERMWAGGGTASATRDDLTRGCPAPGWHVQSLNRRGPTADSPALPRLAPLPDRTTELDLNLLEGRLVRGGRCLRLEPTDGSPPALVVWPQGTTLDVDVVRGESEGEVRIGGPAALDGWNRGWHTPAEAEALGLAEPVPASCWGPIWVASAVADAPPVLAPPPPPPPPAR